MDPPLSFLVYGTNILQDDANVVAFFISLL